LPHSADKQRDSADRRSGFESASTGDLGGDSFQFNISGDDEGSTTPGRQSNFSAMFCSNDDEEDDEEEENGMTDDEDGFRLNLSAADDYDYSKDKGAFSFF
jgi:hypothetical protein